MRRWATLATVMALAVTVRAQSPETAGPKDELKTEPLKNSSGSYVRYGGRISTGRVTIPVKYVPKSREVRGTWVATVDNIDFPVHEDAASFRQDVIAMFNQLQALNINTVFFQVRSMNDAFYPSRLNPPSRYLGGTEGRMFADFDPLAFLITEAHRRGIQFHAWLNPYRVSKNIDKSKAAYLASLDYRNFARRNPAMVLEVVQNGKRQLILDPGEPMVVRFLLETVRELIRNYDLDGIHFDDYFYPYGGCGNADARSFAHNNPRRLTLEDWRRDNINSLIFNIGKLIEAHNAASKKQVQFGISPFGIWRNSTGDARGSLTAGSESYTIQHADTRRWIKEGWIDYIVPQVYWPFEHQVAAYAAVTDWWVQAVRGTKVNLYIGHSPSFYGNDPLWQNYREIPNQLRYNCKHPEIKGEVMFSAKSLLRPDNTPARKSRELLREYWNVRVPPPPCGPYAPPAPTTPKPAAPVPADSAATQTQKNLPPVPKVVKP